MKPDGNGDGRTSVHVTRGNVVVAVMWVRTLYCKVTGLWCSVRSAQLVLPGGLLNNAISSSEYSQVGYDF
jgi:hypothetical protein